MAKDAKLIKSRTTCGGSGLTAASKRCWSLELNKLESRVLFWCVITFWLTDMEVDVVSTKHVVFRFHLSELECTVQPSIAWNYYGIAVAGLPNHLTPFPKGKPYIYIYNGKISRILPERTSKLRHEIQERQKDHQS